MKMLKYKKMSSEVGCGEQGIHGPFRSSVLFFPSSIPWTSRDLLFYVWCPNPQFNLRSCMLYLGNGVVYSFPGDLGLPPLRIGGLRLLEQGQARIHSEGQMPRTRGARRLVGLT